VTRRASEERGVCGVSVECEGDCMRAEWNDDVRGSDEERESEYDSLYKRMTHTR
jgi:hypothetical protein